MTFSIFVYRLKRKTALHNFGEINRLQVDHSGSHLCSLGSILPITNEANGVALSHNFKMSDTNLYDTIEEHILTTPNSAHSLEQSRKKKCTIENAYNDEKTQNCSFSDCSTGNGLDLSAQPLTHSSNKEVKERNKIDDFMYLCKLPP